MSRSLKMRNLLGWPLTNVALRPVVVVSNVPPLARGTNGQKVLCALIAEQVSRAVRLAALPCLELHGRPIHPGPDTLRLIRGTNMKFAAVCQLLEKGVGLLVWHNGEVTAEALAPGLRGPPPDPIEIN